MQIAFRCEMPIEVYDETDEFLKNKNEIDEINVTSNPLETSTQSNETIPDEGFFCDLPPGIESVNVRTEPMQRSEQEGELMCNSIKRSVFPKLLRNFDDTEYTIPIKYTLKIDIEECL